MSTTTLDRQLATRAQSATVDTSPIAKAEFPAELARIGGQLMLATKGNANLAAVQLAMRTRAAELASR